MKTFFTLDFGIRQGSVLSPFLFALYLDNISNLISSKKCLYCLIRRWLLMVPSVDIADQLLKSVERELINLDMVIRPNAKKSCCLRIGPRCNVACRPLSTSSGVEIPWKDKIRYLGAFVVQCRKFKCCLDYAKSHSIVLPTLFWENCSDVVKAKISRPRPRPRPGPSRPRP